MEKIGKFSESGASIQFGSVHEDVATEERIASRVGGIERALVIASGGDTALRMAPLVSGQVNAFDGNPAQIWLCKLRQRALRELDEAAYDQFARLRGASFPREPRPPDWAKTLDRHGADFSGGIEQFLGCLRALLHATVCSRSRIFGILSERDAARRRALMNPLLEGWRWRWGLRLLLSPIGLARRYSSDWVEMVPRDFDSMITRQISAALGAPGSTSAPLWRLLVGAIAEGSNPLRGVLFQTAKRAAERIHFQVGDVFDHLAAAPSGWYQFAALSNILEGQSEQAASAKLRHAGHAMASGSLLVLRSIFRRFPVEIPGFERRRSLEAEMEALDGSPVCRALAIYQRS